MRPVKRLPREQNDGTQNINEILPLHFVDLRKHVLFSEIRMFYRWATIERKLNHSLIGLQCKTDLPYTGIKGRKNCTKLRPPICKTFLTVITCKETKSVLSINAGILKAINFFAHLSPMHNMEKN